MLIIKNLLIISDSYCSGNEFHFTELFATTFKEVYLITINGDISQTIDDFNPDLVLNVICEREINPLVTINILEAE